MVARRSLLEWAMLVLHQDAGDHKGPLHVHSAALAPTDRTAAHLCSRLRLMPIWRLSRVPSGSYYKFQIITINSPARPMVPRAALLCVSFQTW